MDKGSYLAMLEQRHRHYFNVFKDYKVEKMVFDLYAECHVKTERTVLGFPLDSYESHDYRMVKCYDRPLLREIEGLCSWVTSHCDIWVNPRDDHMCTFLTLVVILSEKPASDVISFSKKVKYNRYFKFGLRGWCELRFLLVDLTSGRVWCNGSGKRVKEDFEVKPASSGFLEKILFWR